MTLPGGQGVGEALRDTLTSTLLGSIPHICHLLGEFDIRSGRPLQLVAGGGRMASRITSSRRSW